MPEPTSATPPSSPTPAAPSMPPEKPSASATATVTQTKTKTVVAVGLIAGAAMGVAAAFALLSAPKGQLMVCKGGPVQGKVCRSDRECLGGRCVASVLSRPASTAATRPATKPTTKPATRASLTVAEAPRAGKAKPGIVLAGESNAFLARYAFHSTGATWMVNKMRLKVGSAASVARLTLINELSGAVVANGVPDSQGIVDLSNLGLSVPRDSDMTLAVKADVKLLTAGATSGANIKVTLKDDPGTFQARIPSDSSLIMTSIGGDIGGADKIVRKSFPTLTMVPLPSATLNLGTQSVMRFTVSASSQGDVSLKKLTFNIVKGTKAVFKPAGAVGLTPVGAVGDSTLLPGTASVQGGSIPTDRCTQLVGMTGSCVITVSFATEEVVAAGTSKTYDLKLLIQGALAPGDVFGTTLGTADSVLETGYAALGSRPAPYFMIDSTNNSRADGRSYDLIWSDFSAIPHRAVPGDLSTRSFTGSGDWTNGLYLMPDPITATLVK
ncbi:MAG: hypothetical protein AAB692_01115 [Patescibacteria group bacterium]